MNMISLLFVLIFLFMPHLKGDEPESDFAKNQLFSLFGYNPLMSGSEKELRSLHSSAEAYMRKKEYLPAEKAYEQILARIDPPFISTNKYKVDWATYIDLVFRLSDVKLALKEYKDGQNLLHNLYETHPPSEYLPSINFHLARFYVNQNNPGQAWIKMREALPLLPIEKWRGEDRSFFHGIEYLLNDHFDKLLQKAHRFGTAQNSKGAIEMYEEVLSAIEKGYYPKAIADSIHLKRVRYRLAELYYQEAKFEKTLDLIETQQTPQDKIDCEMLYLAANVYREKREYEKSIECFQSYVDAKEKKSSPHIEHALLEIGLAHYRSGHFSKAKESLQKILSTKGRVAQLSQIYLSKIALKEANVALAFSILNSLSHQIGRDDPLRFEISFLRGEVANLMGDYSLAIEFFESALPSNQLQKEWSAHALYKLGLCYLNLSEGASMGQKKLAEKAEKIFDQLLLSKPGEEIILSLAKLYLKQNKLEKVTDLMNESSSFSLEGKAAALLILAEAQKDYKERDKIFSEVTSERFRGTRLYPECWYRRAVNDFHEGLFTEAIHSFEIAFSLFEKKDLHMATNILQWQACTNLYQNLPLVALTQLETLLRDPALIPIEKEEILYLHGLVASHLSIPEGDLTAEACTKYKAVAEESLLKISSNEKSAWNTCATMALGSFYYRQKEYLKANECFKKLRSLETAPICSSALYWEAESGEKLGLEESEILSCRKKCYENFPFSSLAPLAYFKCFPFEKYLEGDPAACNHIKVFPSLFPSSPLLLLSYYFIGMNEPQRDHAISAFEKALLAYEHTFEKAKEHKLLLQYFRTRSIFELSKRQLSEESTVSELEKITKLLEGACKDLEKNEKLKNVLYEEAKLLLAKSYLQTDQESKGAAILLQLLAEYNEQGVKEGHTLACVFLEQGKIALNHDDLKAAVVCLEMAEVCGQGHLHTEDKLTLWILQSQCFKKQNRLEPAMRLLSKVINEDVISPLRDQAMYLRAEIYELENRNELAIRQLESCAKRGGTFGKAAKEKLRSYGL